MSTLWVPLNRFFLRVRAPHPRPTRITHLISIISAGTLKYKYISKFFNSVLDGTANLTAQIAQVPDDSQKPTAEEQEIGRKHMDDLDEEEEGTDEREEDIIHRAIRLQIEKEEREAKDAHIDSSRQTGETDPVVLEQRMADETAHPSNMKAPSQLSETCKPGTVTGSVLPSCTSPVSERDPLPIAEDTTSESGRIKDEL